MAIDPKGRSSMANWSDLSLDFLVSIANLMVLVEDFVAFGLVCKAWRLAAGKENFTAGLTQQVPWLLLSRDRNNNNHTSTDNISQFYNLRNGKTHKFSLAESKSKVHSSSLGWLIIESEDFGFGLLHPLNHYPMVKLPKLIRYIRDGVGYPVHWDKFALSSSPSTTSDYVVMGIHNFNRLVFCKPGDDEWTLVDEGNVDHACYHDIAYYKGHLYVVDSTGQVGVFCIEEPKQARNWVINDQLFPRKREHYFRVYYLVESRGVLLAITMDSWEWRFRVFEVSFNDGNWSEVTDLGNRMLFLGRSSSFSVEASTYSSCKTNCIYFTRHHSRVIRFSMADKKMDACMFEYSGSLVFSFHIYGFSQVSDVIVGCVSYFSNLSQSSLIAN